MTSEQGWANLWLRKDRLHSKELLYIYNQNIGICPGDKVPTSENPLLCSCPKDSIEVFDDDKCFQCVVGEEVPNQDQTACVGKLSITGCLNIKWEK